MRQLTPEQLKDKIKSLQAELVSYQTAEQNAINDMTQAVQQRVRTAQKHVDNLEGQIQAFANVLSQLEPALAQPAVDASPPAS